MNGSVKDNEKYLSVKTGGILPGMKGSRNVKQVSEKNLSQKMTDLEFAATHDNRHIGDDEVEGTQDFNTEDALKQDVNPVHPVNIAGAFGPESHRDLNSSRGLKQKNRDGEYNFSTPMTRSTRHNFEQQNKENATYSADCKEGSSESIRDR